MTSGKLGPFLTKMKFHNESEGFKGARGYKRVFRPKKSLFRRHERAGGSTHRDLYVNLEFICPKSVNFRNFHWGVRVQCRYVRGRFFDVRQILVKKVHFLHIMPTYVDLLHALPAAEAMYSLLKSLGSSLHRGLHTYSPQVTCL